MGYGPRKQCRNGHKRTAENTHVDAAGVHRCKDCPSWTVARMTATKRPPRKSATYHRELSPDQLAHLRRLIPCLGCGLAYGDGHREGCSVSRTREDDGPADENVRAA